MSNGHRSSANRFEAHLKRTSERYWVTKTGEAIRPKDMGYGHLANALAMIRRWGACEKLDRELYCLAHLSATMGDGAYDAVESEARGLERTTAHEFCVAEVPVYRTMRAELESRRMG